VDQAPINALDAPNFDCRRLASGLETFVLRRDMSRDERAGAPARRCCQSASTPGSPSAPSAKILLLSINILIFDPRLP